MQLNPTANDFTNLIIVLIILQLCAITTTHVELDAVVQRFSGRLKAK